MKRISVFLVALAVAAGLSVLSPALGQDLQGLMGEEFEWDFSLDVGQMFFSESLSETDLINDIVVAEYADEGKWDGFFVRANFRAGNYDYQDLEAGLNFNIFGSANQDAIWDELYVPYANGVPFEPGISQDTWEGSLDVHGFELIPEIGWGGELADGLRCSGFFGYGYRRTEHEYAPSYDSNYDVHWINFRLRVLWDVPDAEGLSVLIEPTVGPVVASKITDDYFTEDFTIRGEGGIMVSIRGQVKYEVADNVRLLVGAFYDLQSLDGGTDEYVFDIGERLTERYDWDDHLTQAVGATLGVEFEF